MIVDFNTKYNNYKFNSQNINYENVRLLATVDPIINFLLSVRLVQEHLNK